MGLGGSGFHFFPLPLQIRDKFDAGEDVELDDMNPHDVACLLKEFFRSLPEPLMTVELFGPFLATTSEWVSEWVSQRVVLVVAIWLRHAPEVPLFTLWVSVVVCGILFRPEPVLLLPYLWCVPKKQCTLNLSSSSVIFFFFLGLGLGSSAQRRDALRLLCLLLPPPNRDTLQELLQFLSRVALHSDGIILIDGTEVGVVYGDVPACGGCRIMSGMASCSCPPTFSSTCSNDIHGLDLWGPDKGVWKVQQLKVVAPVL